MRVCLKCAKEIRDGADFCTSCGAPAPAPDFSGTASEPTVDASGSSGGTFSTDVPLITLAPERSPFTKQRLLRTVKMVVGMIAVVVIVIGGIVAFSYLSKEPFKESPFSESSELLSGPNYRDCLALVGDVRNDNFDELIHDIIQMEGEFENYNFLIVYEQLFKDIVPDDSEDVLAIKFRDCCYMVSYTEFTAKKFEDYASSGLLSALYVDDAEMYRSHADHLWDSLNNAQAEEHLDYIINYCAENDIIYLKDTQADESTE